MKAIDYSKVCGKIIGYQVGSPDTFSGPTGFTFRRNFANIDISYVDGVSLTHGNPRQHIWTFAAGLDEEVDFRNAHYNCPCTDSIQASRATPPPAFVGGDYFCDTGSAGRYKFGVFYGEDPLWDGAGCGALNTCCSLNNPPWFYKQLPQATADNIEIRICTDELS